MARESRDRARGRPPLRRMVATLIDNAISHTEPSGRSRSRCGPATAPHLELEVADDGTGFDPADCERIFERFAQSGHSGPRRFGLGLALAREIAADHGGTIRAVGRPGAGATSPSGSRPHDRVRRHADVATRAGT